MDTKIATQPSLQQFGHKLDDFAQNYESQADYGSQPGYFQQFQVLINRTWNGIAFQAISDSIKSVPKRGKNKINTLEKLKW